MKKETDAPLSALKPFPKFDLTKKDGVNEALRFIDSDPKLKSRPVGRFFLKNFVKLLATTLSTTESTLQEQRQTALEVIKAGKESGVQSMELTLDQQVGLHFGSDVGGVPIKATIGKSGTMTIKVTYK